MKQVFRGAAWDSLFLTIVKLTTTLISIVTTKVMATSLSLNQYGTYSQGLLVISVTASVIILGMNDAVNYFYNRTEDLKRRCDYVNTIFAVEAFLGVVAAIVILLFRKQICAYFSNALLETVLYVICLKALFENILNLFSILYVSIGEAKKIAIRNLILSLIRLPIILIFVKNDNSVVLIFSALLIVDLLQTMYFYWGFKNKAFGIQVFRYKKEHVAEILKYGIPMGAYVFVNTLNRDLDKLLIGNLGTTDMLAVYTNCARILPFDILMGSVATVMIPFVVKYVNDRQYEKAASIFRSYVWIGALSVWTLAGGAIVVAPELVVFLYDAKYLVGTNIFIVYLMVDIVKFVNMSLFLTAKGKSMRLLKYSIASLLCNAVLNYVFFRIMGSIGPAIATLIVTSLLNATILIDGAHVIETPVKQLIDLKKILLFISELILTGVAAFYLKGILLQLGVHSMVVLILIYGSFVASNLLINLKRLLNLFRELNTFRIG